MKRNVQTSATRQPKPDRGGPTGRAEPDRPVLLVQPLQGEYTRTAIFQPGVEIPLNLLSLEAYLDRFGIPCEILDFRILKSPREALFSSLEQKRPSMVGISAYTPEIENASRIAADVKQVCPEVPVVIGGYQATAVPEETLRAYPAFDYLVHGEGELVFLDLVQNLRKGEPVEGLPGLVWRDRDDVRINPRRELIQDLDSLPFIRREVLDLSHYVPKPGTGNFLRLPSTGIMASRGCPYTCYYCSKGVWGTSIRFRSIENVLSEIELCMDRHGIRDFRFFDDALPLPRWNLKGFCRELIARKMNISWNCYSRVDLVDPETLRLMKEAGCYHIKYGIEFGTQVSLERSNKKTNLEQARSAIRLTKREGIECKANFILAIPGERVEDCEETVRFAIELSPDLASFYPFYPAPASVFAQRLETDPEFARGLLPEEQREAMAREAYRKFYLRFGFIVQRLRRFLRYPVRETRVVTSALWMMGIFFLRRAAGK